MCGQIQKIRVKKNKTTITPADTFELKVKIDNNIRGQKMRFNALHIEDSLEQIQEIRKSIDVFFHLNKNKMVELTNSSIKMFCEGFYKIDKYKLKSIKVKRLEIPNDKFKAWFDLFFIYVKEK